MYVCLCVCVCAGVCVDSLLKVLLWCQQLAVDATEYRIEVQLSSYRNPLNQNSLGQCCDLPTTFPCSQPVECSKCDPYFSLTVTGSDLVYTTPVYFNTDSLTHPTSPFVFYGNSTVWPQVLFMQLRLCACVSCLTLYRMVACLSLCQFLTLKD